MTVIKKLAITHFLLAALAAALPASSVSTNPLEAAVLEARSAQACPETYNNNDNGRWDDPMDPAGRLFDLCTNGGGCHQAAIGRMCVHGDQGQCVCAVEAAKGLQYWKGN